MSLGRASKLIVMVILVIPLAFQGALADTPPVHENFEKAREDLEVLMDLLGDSMVLSEETLYFLVHMEFTPENLSIAMEKADEFHDLLEGAEILLEFMRGEATSVEYLEEYLRPFQDLDINTTGLIQFYIYLNENLTVAENYLNDNATTNTTVDAAVQALNNSESNAEAVKDKVNDIENNTKAINETGFSTVTLEELIIETKELVESDGEAIEELSELFTIIPNFLSIYVHKIGFALGDEFLAYGYFFGEGDFKSVENITIFMDDQILDEVSTDSNGRYEFKTEIPLNHTLGVFEIHASTMYNNSLYVSHRTNITISKIPTILTLSTPLSDYSLDEPVPFSGRLLDHKDTGLADENITLNFDDMMIANISTDIGGNFSFELNTTGISFGVYGAQAMFESDDEHTGSVSEMVEFSINIPTRLMLSILETAIYVGENITFFGQLTDELDNIPLSDMTIELYIEDEKVGEVVTDNLGRYEYLHSSFGMAIGKYNVHSEFNPMVLNWRESVSDIIEVEIQGPQEPAIRTQGKSLMDRIYDNLFLIVLLILVFLVPAVFYMRKRRAVPAGLTQRAGKKIKRKAYSNKTLKKKLLKETEDLDSKLSSLKGSKNLREAIIAGYHTLLGILEKNKVIRVKPSHTHLDIAQKLADEGFPTSEIGSVTDIFEKAMYSNRPIASNTIDDFMAGIRKMFTQAGGTKG